jgi:hypothetical protein
VVKRGDAPQQTAIKPLAGRIGLCDSNHVGNETNHGKAAGLLARFLHVALKTWPCIVLLFLLNGCATSALWKAGSVDFHEPYPPSRLELFDAPQKNDLLVVYDELSPGGDTARRRAYFLRENEERIKSVQKPRFVSLNATNGLRGIPLLGETNAFHPHDGFVVYARTNGAGNRFTVFRGNESGSDRLQLPAYRCWITGAKRALLTPVTLILDVTVIGGYLYARGFAESGSTHTISL